LCVFARLHGEELGLDIEHGSRQEIATVMGNFVAYGHTVGLSVLDLEFDSTVYFAADTGFNRTYWAGKVGSIASSLGWSTTKGSSI
jgi:hypothetical protein